MNQSSLTDADRAALQRAAELADLNGADAVRAWAGSTTYDVSSTLAAYVELAGACQALLGDLSDIVRRLGIPVADDAKADEDEDETFTCVRCGGTVGIFQGHGDGWRHYRGSGTAADPNVLYEPEDGHPATPGGMLP